MTHKPAQFTGGVLGRDGGSRRVCPDHALSALGGPKDAIGSPQSDDLSLLGLPRPGGLGNSGVSITPNCDSVLRQGQHISGQRSESLARKRYQQGSLMLRGKRRKVWVLRWRDDVRQADGSVRRVERKTVLGTQAEVPTAKLARRRAEQVLARVNSPDYRPIKTATFEQFVELWRGRSLSLRKPYTQKSANYHLRVHLLPALAHLRLDQIDREQVQELVSKMAANVRRHTILNVLGTLRTILRTARSWGYLAGDFAASQLTIPAERTRSAARFFTAEQARRIIEEAEQPWKCLFAIAAMTGLRPGEVLGLCGEDIDLEGGLIYVRRTACFGRLVAPKTPGSASTVPIPEPLRAILVDYLTKRKPNDAGLLFATRNGRPYTTNKVNQYRLSPLLGKLAIPCCSLNGFRHTHASLLVSLGASPVVAQRQLRHADPMTTLRNYAHIVGPEQREAAEKVARILWPNAAGSDGETKWLG